MRKKEKSFFEALLILIPLLLLVLTVFNTVEPRLEYGEPLDFYGTSREVSLTEMVEVASKFNMSVYLPSELPNNLKHTTIYLKDSPFVAIIVFSAESNKDYKTAELTIQISPSSSPPTYNQLISQAENNEYETVLEIKGNPVLINEKAYSGGEEKFKEKYGDYILLVLAWIDGMRYTICCPTLMTDEAIQLVEDMYLLTS